MTLGGGLDRLRDGHVEHRRCGGSEILSVLETADRMIWAGTTAGVFQIRGDSAQAIPGADGSTFRKVFAMAQDKTATLWMADSERGLATVRNGRIVPADLPDLPNLPAKEMYQLATTQNGDLWVGYMTKGVAVVSHGCVCRFDSHNGMAEGTVQAIFEDHLGNVWVGTNEGLSRYRGGAWTTWTEHQGLPAGGVQAIIEDLSSRLWVLTATGLAALPVGMQTSAGAKMPAALTVYGPGDGIRLRGAAGLVNPRLTMSPDGRLWFGTADGLAVFDPASVHLNRVPPPVAIEELVVDGRREPLPAGGGEIRGRSIEMEYTPLSLTLPETVRFRYRLEPVNKGWMEAGTTRRMAYASLSPGRYHFHVTACNNDGVWNPVGANLDFTIDPRFYQTWWFAAVVAAAIGLAGLGLHRGRMRLMRLRFQLILQERMRLARDMHDTLLQGFAGAVYQLAAASRLMNTAPERGQERLSKALEQADQSLAEARQMLSSLRLSALENRTLVEALEAAGEQITADKGIHFEMSVQGRQRELPYDTQASLYIIAREAMSNAANHAEPDRIALELQYSADRVAMTVRDTGKGFDLEAAEKRPNHWGLAGMRERARQVGGTLAIRTTPGGGTTLEVWVGKPFQKSRT